MVSAWAHRQSRSTLGFWMPNKVVHFSHCGTRDFACPYLFLSFLHPRPPTIAANPRHVLLLKKISHFSPRAAIAMANPLQILVAKQGCMSHIVDSTTSHVFFAFSCFLFQPCVPTIAAISQQNFMLALHIVDPTTLHIRCVVVFLASCNFAQA